MRVLVEIENVFDPVEAFKRLHRLKGSYFSESFKPEFVGRHGDYMTFELHSDDPTDFFKMGLFWGEHAQYIKIVT